MALKVRLRYILLDDKKQPTHTGEFELKIICNIL